VHQQDKQGLLERVGKGKAHANAYEANDQALPQLG
jgi:hypothetical protein